MISAQGSAVHVIGRGLACTLGVGVDACIASLRQGLPSPHRVRRTPELGWPYYPITENSRAFQDEVPWKTRARNILLHVIEECGVDACRDDPLFIASSSLDVGELEQGGSFPPDGLAFVEELAAWLEWRGPIFWVSSACTSALNAVLSAKRMIEAGQCEQALVLGVELQNQYSAAGFSGMQLLASDVPKPLGLDRDGLVLGEAVAALLLGRRPARWRLLGGTNKVNGENPVGADQHVLAEAVGQTLELSRLTPEQIDLVKLQAAGSPQNDAEEIYGLRKIFDPLPPLVTFKSFLGHTLGASGAAELVLLQACLETGVWPAQANYEMDPLLAAQCCEAPSIAPRRILFNILGFGGGHCCLVFEDTTHNA